MAQAVRAVPPSSFSLPRFARQRKDNEFARWLGEPAARANDFYAPPALSLEDEVFLGRMRAMRPPQPKPQRAYKPYAALPVMNEDGQYVFEFMRLPLPPMGARMDEMI